MRLLSILVLSLASFGAAVADTASATSSQDLQSLRELREGTLDLLEHGDISSYERTALNRNLYAIDSLLPDETQLERRQPFPHVPSRPSSDVVPEVFAELGCLTCKVLIPTAWLTCTILSIFTWQNDCLCNSNGEIQIYFNQCRKCLATIRIKRRLASPQSPTPTILPRFSLVSSLFA